MSSPKLSDRNFGLTFSIIFAIITFAGWYFFDVFIHWTMIFSITLLALAFIAPGILLPFNCLWGLLVGRIHRVVNFTLLGIFFFIIVFPFGQVMRIFGRDALERKSFFKSESYWRKVKRHTDETTLHDMF